MDETALNKEEKATIISQEVAKLILDIENEVSLRKKNAKECKELNILKEKCCNENTTVALTACQGIRKLAEKNILVRSQAISTLISLMSSVTHYNALVSTIGSILLLDLKEQQVQMNVHEKFQCFDNDKGYQHPFVTILRSKGDEAWFEIFFFIHNLAMSHNDVKLEYKLNFIKPIVNHVFSCPKWKGSQFQTKLFNHLMVQINNKAFLNLALETLMWQDIDIQYCMFVQEIFTHLLNGNNDSYHLVVQALTPTLAETIKWLIHNGYNPTSWLNLLHSSIQTGDAALGVVLCILTDVITDIPSCYINAVINICKLIICSGSCNKYIAHRFIAASLNWLISPSLLAHPVHQTMQKILVFVGHLKNDWNDQTSRLMKNEYFIQFGSNNFNIKFILDVIRVTNSWCKDDQALVNWLKNIKESGEPKIQLKLHSYIYGIILCENDKCIIDLCLEILLELVNHYKSISFSQLCLLFYKLSKETEPTMQKTYLLYLPKLAVKKENIPLIVGTIEALKKGTTRITTPLIIQLFVSLWKMDNRTYPYLHKLLHNVLEKENSDALLELNLSKALALREICHIAPHLHGKDVIGVVSRILNECSHHSMSGLPSAITIEAIIELCKAYVIDVSGTWDAIQPKLSTDERPKVIKNLCKFFAEIPSLNAGKKCDELTSKIVPILWEYTMMDNDEVVKYAFKALSKFEIENLELKLCPPSYWTDLKLPSCQCTKIKNCNCSLDKPLELSSLPYVPAECWIRFLQTIELRHQNEGGKLISSMIERELNSLPRGHFYLPPEKSEPSSYSYLPQNSICYVFVSHLQRHLKANSPETPKYIIEIVRILSEDYSKALPPLDWGFLAKFLTLNAECSLHTLGLLAKQGSLSKSAKLLLENYLSEIQWNCHKLEEIIFLYSKISNLCMAVSSNIFQKFCGETLKFSLQCSLKNNSYHFDKIMNYLWALLKNKNVANGHKTTIAKQLENILPLIPADHKTMKSYALCATELPLKSFNNITLVTSATARESDWLDRAIIIRQAIAMRSDLKNPLVWFNQFFESLTVLSGKKDSILHKVVTIIRSRRKCSHITWIEELMWKIQSSIADNGSTQMVLLLIDVFMCSVIVLSGYDSVCTDINDLARDSPTKTDVFVQSIALLMSFPPWTASKPKTSLWLQSILKWKHLPPVHKKVFAESVIILGSLDENTRQQHLNLIC